MSVQGGGTQRGESGEENDALSLVKGLEEFCLSSELSLDALRDKISQIPPNAAPWFVLHNICLNESGVSLEIVEYFLDMFPKMEYSTVECDEATVAFPLHLACYNEFCPSSVIELLMEKNDAALRLLCIIGGGRPSGGYDSIRVTGLPLHYYLARESNIDIATVKMLVEAYPEALTTPGGMFSPNSVIKLLVKRNPSALRHLCLIVNGARCGEYDGSYVYGPPLHVLLCNPNIADLCDVLLFIVQTEPDAIRMTGGFGEVPLHLACKNSNASSEVVQMLLDFWPESIYQRNNDGDLPIHTLCLNGHLDDAAAFDILYLLVKKDPQLVRETNGNGHLPIYLAASNKPPEFCTEIVRILLDVWPDVRQNRFGDLPIHDLCRNKELDDTAAFYVLQLLLKMDPQSVRETNDDGELPMHVAAGSKSPNFCNILIDAYPESVRIQGGQATTLPISYACFEGRVDNVKHLLELYPESINARDRRGFLPIHWAAQHDGKVELEIIRFLLSKDPDSASKPTNADSIPNHRLPLHLACTSFTAYPLSAVQLLFDAYPEAIFKNDGHGITPFVYARRVAAQNQNNSNVVTFLETQLAYANQAQDMSVMTTLDQNGWLPLHHALRNNACLGSIKLLVKGNPSALRVIDYSGLFPLHIACEFSMADVLQFLVELNDTCLNHCDENKNSPLHYACRGGNCSTVKYLLERHAPSVSERNADNKLPIHLLCESDTEKVDHDCPEFIEAIWCLLLAYPETVLQDKETAKILKRG